VGRSGSNGKAAKLTNRVIQYMLLALDGDSLAQVMNEYGRMRA
jgi:restriction endonuclease Mrr